MRKLLLLTIIGALVGCAADLASPHRAPFASRGEFAANQPLSEGGIRMGRDSRPRSPEDQALVARILNHFPEGDAREAMRETLVGSAGFLIQVRRTGDSQVDPMLDSLAILRGFNTKEMAHKNSASHISIRIQ
jgi:hypothetical protein